MTVPIHLLMSVVDGVVQGSIGKAIKVASDGTTEVSDYVTGTGGGTDLTGGEGGLSPGIISIPTGVGSTNSGSATTSATGPSYNTGNYTNLNSSGSALGGTSLDSYESLVAYFSTAKRDVNSLIFGWTDTYQDEVLDANTMNDKPIVGILNSGPGYTTVQYADGSTARLTGSRGIRNNNPGNLIVTNFTKSQKGYIGNDRPGQSTGSSGVFATYADGFNAYKNLVFNPSGSYYNKTISDAIYRYAPPSENNTERYISEITTALGVSRNTRLSSLSPAQQQQFIATQFKVEGTLDSRYSSSVTENPSNAHVYVMEDGSIKIGLNLETESTFGNDSHGTGSIKVAVVGGKVGASKSQSAESTSTETSHQTIDDIQWRSCTKIIRAFHHAHPHGNVFGADELGRKNMNNYMGSGMNPLSGSGSNNFIYETKSPENYTFEDFKRDQERMNGGS